MDLGPPYLHCSVKALVNSFYIPHAFELTGFI